jgi:hypothetical protein
MSRNDLYDGDSGKIVENIEKYSQPLKTAKKASSGIKYVEIISSTGMVVKPQKALKNTSGT